MKTTAPANRGKQPQQTQPTTSNPPPAVTVEEALTVTLSPEASGLVRWYCDITHHFPAAAVEGAVFGTLERAQDAYSGGPAVMKPSTG